MTEMKYTLPYLSDVVLGESCRHSELQSPLQNEDSNASTAVLQGLNHTVPLSESTHGWPGTPRPSQPTCIPTSLDSVKKYQYPGPTEVN